MKKSQAVLTWANAPDVLTAVQAAQLLRIPRNAVYGAIQAGFIPAANFGQRRIRICKEALRKVFDSVSEQPPETAAFYPSEA